MKRYIVFMWSQYDAAGGWNDKVEGSFDTVEDAVKAVKAEQYYNHAFWEVIDTQDIGRVVMDDDDDEDDRLLKG